MSSKRRTAAEVAANIFSLLSDADCEGFGRDGESRRSGKAGAFMIKEGEGSWQEN